MEGDKYELEEFIKELEDIKGRHTELVSVYVPVGYDINTVQKQLEQEKSTAINIKSKSTRKNVIEALEKMIRQLKFLKKTPKNGLALFAGNASQEEGESDIKLWTLEPPQPLKARLYRCDQEFVLEPLKEMLEAEEVYGIVVVDRKEASIGLLEGKSITMLQHLTSGVPGKMRAGGQSSQRFHRITEGKAKEFFRRVAESMKKNFFELKKLKGIILGGPGPTKEDFLKEGQLATALKDKIIAIKDIGYADEQGLEMLVEEAKDVLEKQEIIYEKNLLQDFFTKLAQQKHREKAAYGQEQVEKALKIGAVETLILSRTLDRKQIKELKKKADDIGSNVELVSVETEEGRQFESLGKIGAVLRFAI